MADYLTDFQKLMVEVRTELHTRPDLYDKLNGYIEGLANQKNAAQSQYINTFKRLEKADYQLTSLKVTNERIGDTTVLYEKENKAMRDLLRLWV